MNRHPSVRQTLEQLAQLRDALTGLKATSRRIADEAARQRSVRIRGFDARQAGDATALAQALETAAAGHQAAREALEERIQRRDQRLKQAHRAARRAVLDRIEREESRQKFIVQKGTLDADREETTLLEAAEVRLQDFGLRREEQQSALRRLNRRAQAVFRGFPGFRRALGSAPNLPEPASALSPDQLLEASGTGAARAAAALARFGRNPLTVVFRFLPPWVLLGLGVVAGVASVWVLPALGRPGWHASQALGALGLAAAVFTILHFLARALGRQPATTAILALTEANALHAMGVARATAAHAAEREHAVTSARQRRAELGALWDRSVMEAARRREEEPRRCEEKARRIADRLERLAATRRQRLMEDQSVHRESLRAAAAAREGSLAGEREQEISRGDLEFQGQREALAEEWRQRIGSLYAQAEATRAAVDREFPAWESSRWEAWSPPAAFADGIPFGNLEVDVAQLCGGLPEDPLLALPGPGHLSMPLVLSFPEAGSLLLETGATGATEAIATLNQILLRWLASMPPGKLSITLVDPVRLGQSFAGVMHLADYEESLVNHRTWTQSEEIEQRLADLNAHLEKVIQMYLRNEYPTIADFNAQAGMTAEKYHVLVLADFPAGCSDLALKRLMNIAASGGRCGVFTLIHRDVRRPLPECILDPLRQGSVVLDHDGSGFGASGVRLPGVRLVLMPPPGPERMTGFLRQVGLAGRDTGRVRVPFHTVMPGPGQEWSVETTEELRAPIGRTGATKLQYLALGKGTRQHALVAGKTGSGKSTLFHVLIHSLATWCSPDQVEFYLVDFKKGVEFSCYAAGRLPHARVVAIESDREFGLSVLQKVDDELRRRGDLFRQLGVQDLAGHHRATGGQPLPRALLLIDEFQEFFVEDDRISQTASVLLDRIVRQGRAFGIHVVLGSQTLGGAYTLARTTLGQMVVRIALQCNEADALLIMDDTNPAPRLLTRPGEGIYNDRAGMVEGNSPFQTVWLEDQERDRILATLRHRADASGFGDRSPFVFEGNAPALVRTNAELQAVLARPPVRPPATARVWLGAPNSIKGPTTAELHRQSDHHLLIVGQRDDAELALLGVGMLGLAAQYPDGSARFAVLESTVPGSSRQRHLRPFLDAMPPSTVVGRAGELADILGGLHKELGRRRDEPSTEAASTFLFLQGLQHFRALMVEDEFSLPGQDTGSPAGQFRDLLTHGPTVGIHLIVTCDTWQNLVRCLGRKALNHFGLRVLFQMGADDSSSLVDTPKASTLGLHRALLHHGQEGWIETFRPYAIPDRDWVAAVDTALASRLNLPQLPLLDAPAV